MSVRDKPLYFVGVRLPQMFLVFIIGISAQKNPLVVLERSRFFTCKMQLNEATQKIFQLIKCAKPFHDDAHVKDI